MGHRLARQVWRGCVYAATNLQSGKVYIGKAILGIQQRKRSHLSVAKRGAGAYFASALKKHGEAAFEWSELYVSDDDTALLEAEIEIIARARTDGVALYNLAEGGQGPSGLKRPPGFGEAVSKRLTGRKLSADHCAAIGASRANVAMPKWSEERRAKHKATWIEKAKTFRHTDETRRKMSEAAERRFKRPGESEKASRAGKKGAAARWG